MPSQFVCSFCSFFFFFRNFKILKFQKRNKTKKEQKILKLFHFKFFIFSVFYFRMVFWEKFAAKNIFQTNTLTKKNKKNEINNPKSKEVN
jgi:hypothetical protein